MRQLLSLAIIILGSLCVSAQSAKDKQSLFSSGKKIEITGQVKNYIPADNNRFIKFRTYDISGRGKDTSVLINKDGYFNVELFQPFEGDINFEYNDEFITLYSLPGETIKLEIDAKLLKDKSVSSTLIVNGKSALVSNLILDFKNIFKKQHFKTEVPWDDKSIKDEEVAAIRIQRMKEELDFFYKYANKRKINNQHFLDWQKNQLLYSALNEILFESATTRRNKTLTVELLMTALTGIPINNKSAYHNSAYYSFLQYLSSDIIIFVNINPAYEQLKKDNGLNPVPVYIKEADKYSNGLAKQLLYYNIYFYISPAQTGYFIDLFTDAISDPYLQGLFISGKENRYKKFQSYNIIDKIKEYKADDSLKRKLLEIFESEKGKYVNLDFWATWCVPCMHEMPNYSKLIEGFKNQSISFLFFSIDATDEKVNEVKNKYNLNGRFIILTDYETRILNNIMKFSSYPQHFILNPNSDILDDSQVRISSDSGYKIVVEKIKKYLSAE